MRCSRFSGRRNCRCDGNFKRTKIGSGTWRCDWIGAISWCNLKGLEVASYQWAKKVFCWDEIYFWWRCCEHCWNDRKRLRILYKLINKEGQNLRGLTPVLKVLLWGKCSISITCYRVNFPQRNSQLMWQNLSSSYFLKLPMPPSATTTLISSHQHRGRILNQQNDYDSLKTQIIVSIFKQ